MNNKKLHLRNQLITICRMTYTPTQNCNVLGLKCTFTSDSAGHCNYLSNSSNQHIVNIWFYQSIFKSVLAKSEYIFLDFTLWGSDAHRPHKLESNKWGIVIKLYYYFSDEEKRERRQKDMWLEYCSQNFIPSFFKKRKILRRVELILTYFMKVYFGHIDQENNRQRGERPHGGKENN